METTLTQELLYLYSAPIVAIAVSTELAVKLSRETINNLCEYLKDEGLRAAQAGKRLAPNSRTLRSFFTSTHTS